MSDCNSTFGDKVESGRENATSYLSFISSMKRRCPNLGDLDETLKHQEGYSKNEDGRVAVIEFKDSNVDVRRFATSNDLQDYVKHPPSTCTRRLYLLEGLPAKYIEIFGSHLQVDPNLFARQLHAGFWDLAKDVGNSPLLPSHPTCKISFSIRYVEVRDFGNAIRNFEMRCANQPRRISVSRFKGKFDGVGMVRRVTSFWYRDNGVNGWNGMSERSRNSPNSTRLANVDLALILLDPQVGEKFYVGNGPQREEVSIPNSPYRGGYVDFSVADTITANPTTGGPRRISAFDDLCYYWAQSDLTRQLDFTSPTAAAIYLKRYVAAQWMVLCQYNHDLLVKQEFQCHRHDKLVHLSPTSMEQAWSNVQALNTRCASFIEHVESSICQFAASRTLGDFPGQGTNNTAQEDFVDVSRLLLGTKKRMEILASSMTGLVNIIEAKRMKGLSTLGMLFIPLAFTSGIFSMTGDFAPGGSLFWVYFIVALPLVLAIFVAAFAWHSGRIIIKNWLFKMRLIDHETVENFPQPFSIGQV